MGTKTRVMRWNPVCHNFVWALNGDLAIDDSQTGILQVITNSVFTEDIVTSWRQAIPQGLSATTRLTGRIVKVKNPGYFTYRWFRPLVTVPTQISEGHAYGFLPVGAPTTIFATFDDFQKADNDAKIAFVRAIKDTYRSFEGGTFLGELAEAVRMVKRPANALREGVGDYLTALKKRQRGFRHLNPLNRRSAAKKILADTWLEYSFGWSPLMRDIDDGMKAIAEHQVEPNKPNLVYIKREGSSEWNESSTLGILGESFTQLAAKATTTHSAKVKYYGSVAVSNPSSRVWDHYGVSLNDFVPTAWNLLPWSFLADYFVNIGDIIECATFLRGKLAWVNRGQVGICNVRYHPYLVLQPGPTLRSYILGGNTEFEYREVSRVRYTGSLVPTLQFHLPGTGRRLANIAALLPTLKSLTPYR